MRLLLSAALVVLLAVPAVVIADVTIRYQTETASPMPGVPATTSSEVIYMKGNKGVTVSDRGTTIVDMATQEVTIIDTVRRKYATIPASQYGDKMEALMAAMMPVAGGANVADMLKTMKTTCDTKKRDTAETIQGVQAEERDVTCTMTIEMPEAMKDTMPAMSTKMVKRTWTASPSERLRVPGLWQLSGFEVWQEYFMNPSGASFGKMMPEGMKPMMEAMQKDQSATLRMSMEMSMNMAMPGAPAGDQPLMKLHMEVVGLSTELLDDSLFNVPGDCGTEAFEDVMKGITDAAMASVKKDTAKDAAPAAPQWVIPANVKAYVPKLVPLIETEPVAPLGADGKKLQGTLDVLVTVGPKGNVEQAEALSGPEALRKAAVDTVRGWTYRPVIRDGVAVTAYTDAFVDFEGDAPFEYTNEMADTAIRLGDLEDVLPRSPEQKFADLEQDAGGGDKARRYELLGVLALTAAHLGVNEKAKIYANELMAEAQNHTGEGTYSNSIHDGHTALGLAALADDDVATARSQLLESGKIAAGRGIALGWPGANSWGPNMILASELLKRGERDVVLEYLEACRGFWPQGAAKLDSWSEAVGQGNPPAFAGNLRW